MLDSMKAAFAFVLFVLLAVTCTITLVYRDTVSPATRDSPAFMGCLVQEKKDGRRADTGRCAGPGGVLPSRGRPGNDTCSLARIKEYTLTRGYFPDQTRWRHLSRRAKHYTPGWCVFPHRLLPAGYVGKCLRRENITRVVIMGDSNAARFTNYARRALGCRTVRQERSKVSMFHPDPGYYLKDTRPAVTHQRTCRHCHASEHVCPRHGLHLEFISGEYVIDTEILTVRMRPNDPASGLRRLCAGALPCAETHSSQQFVLKEYLAGRYPDLFLYFSNNHDRQIFTAAEFGVYNRLLGDLFDLYLPARTRLLWLTKLHEEVIAQPAPWSAARYEKRWGADEQIGRMNRLLYTTSRRVLAKRANFYPFFDLRAMGTQTAADWALDGVHKAPEWYQHLYSYIFQAVCAEH